MALGRTIDDPNVVTSSTHVVAHLLKSRAVEEASNGNETHDTGVVRSIMVIHFPGGPTPEVDIQIAQVLTVYPGAPFAGRHPILERRRLLRVPIATLNPPAATLGFLLVRRVPNDDGDWL